MIFEVYIVSNQFCVGVPHREINEQEFRAWLETNRSDALTIYHRREQEKNAVSREMEANEPESFWELPWEDQRRDPLAAEHRQWNNRLNRKLKSVNRRHRYPEGFDLHSAREEAKQVYGQAEAEFFGTIEVQPDERYTWDKARHEKVRRFLESQMNVGPNNLLDRQFVKAGAGVRIKRIDFPTAEGAIHSH
jgi:hypothetical protein